MSNSETIFINRFKQTVEQSLNWGFSQNWKQRDYLRLIEMIDEKTGVAISLSTIKRIWHTDFNGSPQPATLDAFAQFIDCKNWVEFKNQCQLDSDAKGKVNDAGSKTKKLMPLIAIASALSIFAAVTLFFSYKTAEPEHAISFEAANLTFSCKTSVVSGVPNTVIFDYDIGNIHADSFFIQQSWNKFIKDPIDAENTTATSTYFYPGYHKAKLLANDSILKEIAVKVTTNGWLSVARYGYLDASPVYIHKNSNCADGTLSITKEDLEKHAVEINSDLMSSYYFVSDFDSVNADNFSFETQIRCDSISMIACPRMDLLVFGEGAIHIIPLTIKGCVGTVNVKFGDKWLYGKNNDFSAFGTDVYNWQTLKAEIVDTVAHIYLNGEHIQEVSFNEGIGTLTGFNFNFAGTGAINFIKVWDKEKQLVFSDNFNNYLADK